MDSIRRRTLAQIFGLRLRGLRERRHWTGDRLAEHVFATTGVTGTKSHYYKHERGEREDITVTNLFALAATLGVSPLVLLLPPDGDERVQITPDLSMAGRDLYRWLIGAGPGPKAPTSWSQAGVRAAFHKQVPYTLDITEQVAQLDIESGAMYQLLSREHETEG
jgi:transcriptional regulator with XRE-family HTH domain